MTVAGLHTSFSVNKAVVVSDLCAVDASARPVKVTVYVPGGFVMPSYSTLVGVISDLLEPSLKVNPSVLQVILLPPVPSKVRLVQVIVTVHLAGLMVNAGTVYSSVSPL